MKMHRFLIFFLSLAALAVPTTSWEASTSGNLAIAVTQGQAITAVGLSNSSFTGGAASGTVVGAISVTMSPASPAFSGSLSLSGTNASQFQISGGNLRTNGVVAAGTYQVNIVATESGVTGSPFTQAEAITGVSPPPAPPPSVVEAPGPSIALYNSPYYQCLTNRYVNGSTGSDSNDGTTPTTGGGHGPWNTIQHVQSAIPTPAPGYCINVAGGNYTLSSDISITHGGGSANKTGYLVYRSDPNNAQPGFTPGMDAVHIIMTGGEVRIGSGTSNTRYIWFDGINFDGNNNRALVCLSLEANANSNPNTHHVWITNSIVQSCQQSGIQWNYTEWLWMIHNTIPNNSSVSGYQGSGISIYEPVVVPNYTPTGTIGSSDPTQDNYWCSAFPNVCYHIVVAYNVMHDNSNPPGGTDGEGLIFDDWGHEQNPPNTRYTGNGLAMGNISYHNGSHGLENNGGGTGLIVFVNNTAYNNNWDSSQSATYRSGLYSNYATGQMYMFNNIGYAIPGSGVLQYNAGILDQHSTVASYIHNNLGYPAGQDVGPPSSYPTTGTNKNDDGVDPKMINPGAATPNFALQAGSPAIGFGQAFTLWQQSGSIDAGACVSGLTSCP
jgi:hypothetical protein